MALFPETIKGKILAVLTVHTDSPPAKICLASFDTEEDIWSESYWQEWYKNFDKYSLPIQRRLEDHIEVGAPPIKTIEGWLLIHSYIRNYFSPQRFFTIEAVLLDSNDPFKIIARTEVPILTPGEYYEKIGLVPNVVFPSGAVVKRDWIYLYYGAADTTCCLALIKTSLLLDQMFKKGKKIVILERAKENPIITPDKKHSWESKATFNPAALYLWGKVHVVYRAMSEDNTSVFGYASTKDGVHIDYRSPKPIYTPRVYFEKKLKMGANSGCEDPRLTKIEGKIYMCYTAFDGKSPTTVALTWITVEDFLAKRWRWAKPQRISPPGIDNKDALIFPEKFNGKYIIVHRCGDDIDLAFSSTLNFKGGTWDEIYQEYCWIAPRRELWDSKKVGAAAPPVKTKEGWVLLYHGFSERNIYRVGAVLLDPRNPTKIIGRTSEPILKPEAPYEKEGLVPNVVFPCGAVLIGKKLFVYYGAADKVIGVAKIRIIELLKALKF